jgi:hypothetical protein
MKCHSGLLLAIALAPASGLAADRSIAVPPTVKSSWAFETHTTGARLRPHQAVGFWQRSSGAKAGVGANFVSVLEYQLPEAAPARVRSASFQFSGKPAHLQCAGAEPVVIDVYAYAADGKADVNDAKAGSRVAQLSADCSDKAAFGRPIDVTAIVRQQSVASGVRFVGFNIRKANNRQGAGLFDLTAGKLTVVLADQAVVSPAAAAKGPQAAPAPVSGTRTAAAPASAPKLSKKEVQRQDRRAYIEAQRLKTEKGDTR